MARCTPARPILNPLSDGAFVIRFGVMRLDNLRDATSLCYGSLSFYGLSFYRENGLSPDEIALLARKPHRLMRKARVGEIRKGGFGIERWGRFPHLTLQLELRPTDDELKRLAALFGDPEANPHPVS